MDIFIILIAPVVAVLAALIAERRPISERQRGTLMLTLGFGIVTFSVVSIFAMEQPAASAIAILGIVFIGVGARRMRATV